VSPGARPKVSIVLAAYNGELYIAEQLDSLLGQDYPDFEIVASDDASTDRTPAILEEYAQRYPERLRLLLGKENIGRSANFERGIRAASGDYIALSDQDDLWLPSKLKEMMPLFGATVNLAFCDLEIVNEDLSPRGYGMWRSLGVTKRELRAVGGPRPYTLLLRRSIVSGCGLITRRDLALAALPFPDKHCMVHDQWLARIASFLGGIAACPLRLVLYRQHPDQQAGGAKLGVADVYRMAEEGFDLERVRRRSDILIEKLVSLGVGAEKLDYARAWAADQMRLERERSEALSPGMVLRYAASGTYWRHFSGLRSLAKDVVRLVRAGRN
jgi:glycosyltransferase involved in cell wall biosynthesis